MQGSWQQGNHLYCLNLVSQIRKDNLNIPAQLPEHSEITPMYTSANNSLIGADILLRHYRGQLSLSTFSLKCLFFAHGHNPRDHVGKCDIILESSATGWETSSKHNLVFSNGVRKIDIMQK